MQTLRKLILVRTEWAWNGMSQENMLSTNIIKQDTYMKFYDTSKPLYLERDTSSISLGVGLLQVRDGMNCG